MTPGDLRSHFPLRSLAVALASYDRVTATMNVGQPRRIDRIRTSRNLWRYLEGRHVVAGFRPAVIPGYADLAWTPPGDWTDRSARPRPELHLVSMTDESMLAALAAKQSR